ncbi:LysR family transcriptional regulator [Bordetella genomosp. 9]|uniref:LysR family transcriptional regulator n=1 Tax=Bordetella genomosp. 9 TaxID=1416803 RepID=A0A1W6Z2U7_9BORD|nr:LysR family transcriptional regulator [Bordetella genomosp. 9]ARP87439.1 LysR family transcriptional regulator [Bordetella genomosp. 9]
MSSIRTLKTFLAVARHGTFAAAGKEIGLTPAAVGLQIRALEESLNCQLFDRSARAAVLNPAGRALVPEIADIVRRYELLGAQAGADGMSGTVVVGALVSALMGAFADALWTVRQRYPRLDVRLFAGLSSDFAMRVERGELDAAIVTQSPRPLSSNLVWTPLYTEPMILIVPRKPHFPLTDDVDAMLADAPFMRFDRNTWTGILVQDVLDALAAQVRDSMELNSVEAIIELVRHGFGVSIVPRLANVDWERDRALRVVQLPAIDVQRRVGLLERARHSRTLFTEAIKEYFSQASRQGKPGRRRSRHAVAPAELSAIVAAFPATRRPVAGKPVRKRGEGQGT